MVIIYNVAEFILKILGKENVNVFNKTIENIICDYNSYCVFINSKYDLSLFFKKTSKDTVLNNKMCQINTLINQQIEKNNIQDIIMFLYSIKIQIQKSLNNFIYIPKLQTNTQNNLLEFVKKDLNIEHVEIVNCNINKFSINTVVYVLLPNVLITYSISCFLIKIIKKDLDIANE